MFQRLVSEYREIISFFVLGVKKNTLILRLMCLDDTLKDYTSFIIGELIELSEIKKSEVLAYSRKGNAKEGYQINITIENNIEVKENIIVILKSNNKTILLAPKDRFNTVSLIFNTILSQNLTYTTMIPPFEYEKEEYLENTQIPKTENASNVSIKTKESIKDNVNEMTENIIVSHNTDNRDTIDKNTNINIDDESKENNKDMEKKLITSDIAISLDTQDKEDCGVLGLNTIKKINNTVTEPINSYKNKEHKISEKNTIVNSNFQLGFEESIKYTFSNLLISDLNKDIKYLVNDESETPSLNENKIQKVYKITQSELENSSEISFELLYNVLKTLNIQISENFILVGYSKGKSDSHGELLFMIPVEKSFLDEYIKNKSLTYTSSKINSELKYLTYYYTY